MKYYILLSILLSIVFIPSSFAQMSEEESDIIIEEATNQLIFERVLNDFYNTYDISNDDYDNLLFSINPIDYQIKINDNVSIPELQNFLNTTDTFADLSVMINSTHATNKNEIFENNVVELPDDYGIFQNFTHIENADGTYLFKTHKAPYLEDYDGSFIPYRIQENDTMIQVEFNDGKYVFDKQFGAVTIFDSLGNVVIGSDSYVVKSATVNTDVWNNLDVNNVPVVTNLIELDDDKIVVTFTRTNNEGIYEIKYELDLLLELKTTAYFTNLSLEDQKISFTQSLNLDDEIKLINIPVNATSSDVIEQTIVLSDYVGQTFTRDVLVENYDLIMQIKDIKYNAGLGFDQLWAVTVHENAVVSLDYGNQSEDVIEINQTVELDPTFNYNSGSTSGSISGYTFTFTAITNASEIYYWEHSGSFSKGFNAGNTNGAGTQSVTTWLGASTGAKDYCYDTTPSHQSSTWQPGYSTGWKSYSCSKGTSGGSTDIGGATLGMLQSGTGKSGASANCNYWSSTLGFGGGSSACTTGTVSGTWTASVQYAVANPPSAPQSLAIDTQDVANEITLNWSAPSSDGGASVTNYKIYLGGSLIDTIGNVLTYDDTISGGEIGASLSYTVKAVNSAGDSPDSNTATVTSWNVPSQVGTVTGTSGTAPSLSWSAPSSEASITNYKIYRQGSLHDTISSSSTTYADSTNVSSGSTYAYTVSAVSGVGEGAQSASVNVVAGVPPDAPTSISATIANTATAPFDVVVTWSSPSTVGTGTLSNFQIFRDGVSQGTVGLVTTFANTVPSSGTYAYTVKAISNHGTSVASSADSITTASAPSQPTLTVTVLSDTSHKLDWSASNENGSTLQGYKIEYSLDNSSWSNLVSNTGNTAVTRTATSLNVDDQYYWKVSGINGAGTGTASSTQNAWTLLSAPTNLVATSTSTSNINLAWTGISGISSYTIQYESPTGNGFTNLATSVSSGATTYSSGSLTTGTQYNYRIFGVSTNSGSNSVASNENSATTWGILPAPVLDTLTSVTVNPATVQLDWTASVGSPSATGYKIERNLGSGFVVLESDTASVSTTYTDSATTTMNEPIYRVSSINSYGTSDPSNELTLTITSSGGSGGGGGGSSSSKQTTTIDDLLNVSIIGNTHIMTVGEFITGKIPVSWDSGENLRISDIDYDDSILGSIKFNIEESTPIILQGSGNSFSSGDITYTISTPNDLCNNNIRNNCLVETIYDLPVTVTSVSNGDSISQTTLITIDTSAGFGGQTLALLSIFIMAIIAGVGIIKFARKSGGKRKSVKSSNGKKKARKSIK